jgi:PAS domain S-box-containing protein
MQAKSFNNKRDFELYNFTLENLPEAVFWIDSSSKILQVNKMACQMTGYSKEELLSMSILDVNPTPLIQDFKAYWARLKKERKLIFESLHRNKAGFTYEVEISGNYVEFEEQEISCSIVRDLRKKKYEEHLLRTISEQTSGLTGQDYFYELAKYITTTLNVRYSIVTECSNEEKTRVRTLCYVDRMDVKENIEYDLKGTPCDIIMKGNDFFQATEVQKFYPREKDIESYIGVPIYSPATGDILGHIAAFNPQPMSVEQNQTAILKIFAARAGAEIERMAAHRKLEKANQELQLRLKEIERLKNQLQAENKYLQEEIKLNHNFEEIISVSKNFQKILQQIEQVAETDATVLILGESGTGKELIARAIHNISHRRKKALVKVNCATLPANLIESELFGHERGAFTGAMERKVGRFELADGGTIFLDEVGELPVELQAKLLRVLQEGEFERLGNPKTIKVDVRVIAATNRNLEQAIEKKEFREDLYYRLNVFPIYCIPLRQRKDDIPLLVKHFCQKHEAKIGKKITNIPAKVMDALVAYDWPGNIRELENIIERALILSRNSTLEYGDWLPTPKTTSAVHKALKLDEVEKEHIVDVLRSTNWKVSGERGAAKILGLNATTLEARMKKLGIKREA